MNSGVLVNGPVAGVVRAHVVPRNNLFDHGIAFGRAPGSAATSGSGSAAGSVVEVVAREHRVVQRAHRRHGRVFADHHGRMQVGRKQVVVILLGQEHRRVEEVHGGTPPMVASVGGQTGTATSRGEAWVGAKRGCTGTVGRTGGVVGLVEVAVGAVLKRGSLRVRGVVAEDGSVA